jgi:N-acetyl-alpha-D-glucosaminyl L-malate synthase BshA
MTLRIGITSFAASGGSGILATELGRHLAMRGHQVHFISSALPLRLSGFEPNLCFHRVEMTTYTPFPSAPYSLALASKMTEVALSADLDLLHVHYAIPHAASAYLAKQMLAPRPLKTITTLHGTDITLVGREPSFFPLTRFAIEQSDAVTAVSQWLHDETVREFGTTREIRVIPNFVDTDVFRPRPDLRAANPLRRGDEKLIIHASNFRPVKNVHRVAEIFAMVRQDLKCRLVLVGDGPELATIERLTKRLGVHDDVLFLGVQEEMEEVMAMADVLILPSEHESFGLVALEAISCGVPVVVSNRGGLPEVITEGESGFLRDPHDVPAFAAAVTRILSEPELAARMGETGRSISRERFCIRCVITDYLDLYSELLGRPLEAEAGGG